MPSLHLRDCIFLGLSLHGGITSTCSNSSEFPPFQFSACVSAVRFLYHDGFWITFQGIIKKQSNYPLTTFKLTSAAHVPNVRDPSRRIHQICQNFLTHACKRHPYRPWEWKRRKWRKRKTKTKSTRRRTRSDVNLRGRKKKSMVRRRIGGMWGRLRSTTTTNTTARGIGDGGEGETAIPLPTLYYHSPSLPTLYFLSPFLIIRYFVLYSQEMWRGLSLLFWSQAFEIFIFRPIQPFRNFKSKHTDNWNSHMSGHWVSTRLSMRLLVNLGKLTPWRMSKFWLIPLSSSVHVKHAELL